MTDTQTNPVSNDALALVARVLLAAIFLLSGLAKLADPAGTAAYIASAGLPAATLGAWGAGLLETLGGLALISGYRARPAAVALALFTLVAAVCFHANFADQVQMIMFMKNVAITGGLLQLAITGPGRLALGRA